MTTGQRGGHLRRHWETFQAKRLAGTDGPSPVKRVELPKPNGGTRRLGIPRGVDRWIRQMLLQGLQPIFDPAFSEPSYGFRPGRRAHDAVGAAQRYVQGGKSWVVDMDLTQFFDHVNHDILMNRIAKVIRDRRGLRLIGAYLRAGVRVEGWVIETEEGMPQGGPLWPLRANRYLDAWDAELVWCGLACSRYADDGNIYGGSQRNQERHGAALGTEVSGWSYDPLAEARRNLFGREGWIRRPLGKRFWRRGHSVKGRLRALRQLGRRRRSRPVPPGTPS